MNQRLLKMIFLCLLAFSLMACNLQDLLNAAMPSATPQAPAETETLEPVVEFPETFTPPAVLTTTVEAEVVAQTQAAEQTQASPTMTATITSTPTITASPTITPLTYTPTPPPTVTATWTATPVTPTATPKTGTQRSGTSVTATYLSSPPTIDGDWTEWSTDTYSASSVIYGGDSWVGSSDLESNFRLGWDYQYLYIAAEVIDESYAQNASGYDIYKGDSLEILLDANVEGDFSSSAMSGDDYQLGISPGNGGTNGATSAYLYYPSGSRGSRSISIGATGGSSVYYVEAAIPWSVFGVTPEDGDHLGFAFSVSDNDNPVDNVQESMISNVSGRKLLNPTTWGDLTLEDD
ncbi:MAG: sugar-binding protein [Anaerolineaceae bacterium]